MEDSLDRLIARLRDQEGKPFWQRLADITRRREFHLLEDGIYSAIGQEDPDLERLLDAARKAVAFGYTVYLLPNPQGIKSADFIFERKGIYRLYELKTITGKNSVGNRLKEAISQSNRVIQNIQTQYNLRKLAKEIKRFFEITDEIVEIVVLIRGKKRSINRQSAEKRTFEADFRKDL